MLATHWVATNFGGPEVLELRSLELPAPGPGEVTVDVQAAGMNPADWKHIAPGQDRNLLPLTIGYESAGTIAALGKGTKIASGDASEGDEVVTFMIEGGYASALNVRAADVFAKPTSLDFPQAANLLLAGTTAADMLSTARLKEGEVGLLHGASGAVGVMVLQQARLLGIDIIGTASEANLDVVKRYGGTAVAYGDGLEQRVRELAPSGVAAALDTAGTDEAIDVSLALVTDSTRIVTIAAFKRATKNGPIWVGSGNPNSGPFRDHARPHLLDVAAEGLVEVPIDTVFAYEDAPKAFAALMGHHSGKLALVV